MIETDEVIEQMEKCEWCGLSHFFGQGKCMSAFKRGNAQGFHEAREQYGKIADTIPGLREAAQKAAKVKTEKPKK